MELEEALEAAAAKRTTEQSAQRRLREKYTATKEALARLEAEKAELEVRGWVMVVWVDSIGPPSASECRMHGPRPSHSPHPPLLYRPSKNNWR